MSRVKLGKNNFNKFLKVSIVFLTIFAWVFAGWPQLLEFRIQNIEYRVPPEIQEVKAAANFL